MHSSKAAPSSKRQAPSAISHQPSAISHQPPVRPRPRPACSCSWPVQRGARLTLSLYELCPLENLRAPNRTLRPGRCALPAARCALYISRASLARAMRCARARARVCVCVCVCYCLPHVPLQGDSPVPRGGAALLHGSALHSPACTSKLHQPPTTRALPLYLASPARCASHYRGSPQQGECGINMPKKKRGKKWGDCSCVFRK
jgi:hypothetical protein